MVQGHGLDRTHGILEDSEETGCGLDDERMGRHLTPPKAIGGMERRLADGAAVKFPNLDDQWISVDQIPGIAAQFSVHIVDQTRRAIEAQLLAPSQRHTHYGVETDEMVHVRMRNENLIGPQKTGRAERIVAPQVEQQRPLRPPDVHVDARDRKSTRLNS